MAYTNWVRPTEKDLKKEYYLEYEIKPLKNMLNDVWPTEQDFLDAARAAKLETIRDSEDDRMAYRTHTQSKESLINLIKGYRSYPKFRNEQTIENLYTRFGNNKTMTAPIVIRWKDTGKMRVMGGNTRMDVARQMNIPIKALVLDV